MITIIIDNNNNNDNNNNDNNNNNNNLEAIFIAVLEPSLKTKRILTFNSI